MDVKCKKTKCLHNNNYSCMKKDLIVDKNNVCKSFVGTDKKVDDKTKKIFFEKVEYAPFVHCKTKDITCKSKCIFANSDKCCANGITVCESDDKATCITHKRELD